MATLDFTPLYHSTVGFDRLPSLLAHALERDESGSGGEQHRCVN